MTRVLAALLPPLVVLSAAHELYLLNQQELGSEIAVLRPFWLAAAALVVLALLGQRMDRRAVARGFLAAYYTGGLAFIAWGFLRAVPLGAYFARWVLDTPAGAMAFGSVCLFAAVRLGTRPGPRRVEPSLAAMAAVFALHQAAALTMRLESRPPSAERDLAAEIGGGGNPARPNIYHILLDALPDEHVEAWWPPEAEAFAGFVRSHARSPRRSTLMVLPAIFSGRWIPEGLPADDRLTEAFTGSPSLLAALKKDGYRTTAFVPDALYVRHLPAFDFFITHGAHVREPDLVAMHSADFLRLFVYTTLPESLGGALARGDLFGIGVEFFGMADVAQLSTHAQPILSKLSLASLLELEPRLPAHGRYTFVHLLLPHNPYVLAEDCSHSGPPSGPVRTDLARQTQCALLLVQRLLETLDRLGRLEDAIVVVHGDHGSCAILETVSLPEDHPCLQTALLIKASRAHGAPRLAEARALLVDIAPTLLAALGLPDDPRFDGRVLDEMRPR